ncbi:type II toxin-antitoxin system HigA family antitoxin [Rugamonas sp. DEMB1]|uniref:helix-turn-helix domain-containing protein n=1 Tax=Rugamonas sp. DEMB1 TaxID=3039386 RepID=UPI002448F9D4|nr:helix-turn-helix domain-containing protein [Rugamonas sp. DEMB1]WGG48587.1 helix-turn-helix domain-containing protein [Rugamonas sp. DEMB1]
METLVDRDLVAEITSRYQALSSLVPLHAIRNEEDYIGAVFALNQLLDAGAANDGHPLADLVNALANLVSNYDEQHYPLEQITPVAMIRFLMEQHRLSQSDLPEIGGQSVVSEVLNGKRELNVRQIKRLSERFNVPASVFL